MPLQVHLVHPILFSIVIHSIPSSLKMFWDENQQDPYSGSHSVGGRADPSTEAVISSIEETLDYARTMLLTKHATSLEGGSFVTPGEILVAKVLLLSGP